MARRSRDLPAVSLRAPILFDAFARLGGLTASLSKAPKGATFATNNRLPPPLQRFKPGRLMRRPSVDAARASCSRRMARGWNSPPTGNPRWR